MEPDRANSTWNEILGEIECLFDQLGGGGGDSPVTCNTRYKNVYIAELARTWVIVTVYPLGS